jgi:hypothetical protein
MLFDDRTSLVIETLCRRFPQIYYDQGMCADSFMTINTYLRICTLISVNPREPTPINMYDRLLCMTCY